MYFFTFHFRGTDAVKNMLPEETNDQHTQYAVKVTLKAKALVQLHAHECMFDTTSHQKSLKTNTLRLCILHAHLLLKNATVLTLQLCLR